MLLIVFVFVVTPIVELWLLLQIGGAIGAVPTIGIVLGTGILGSWLARREGLRTMRAFTAEANAGRLPARSVVDGVLIFAGGIMLMAPGVVTDVLGLSLLLPPSRALVRAGLLAWVQRRIAAGQIVWFGPSGPAGPFEPRRPGPPPPAGPIIDATLDDEPGDQPDAGPDGEPREGPRPLEPPRR